MKLTQIYQKDCKNQLKIGKPVYYNTLSNTYMHSKALKDENSVFGIVYKFSGNDVFYILNTSSELTYRFPLNKDFFNIKNGIVSKTENLPGNVNDELWIDENGNYKNFKTSEYSVKIGYVTEMGFLYIQNTNIKLIIPKYTPKQFITNIPTKKDEEKSFIKATFNIEKIENNIIYTPEPKQQSPIIIDTTKKNVLKNKNVDNIVEIKTSNNKIIHHILEIDENTKLINQKNCKKELMIGMPVFFNIFNKKFELASCKNEITCKIYGIVDSFKNDHTFILKTESYKLFYRYPLNAFFFNKNNNKILESSPNSKILPGIENEKLYLSYNLKDGFSKNKLNTYSTEIGYKTSNGYFFEYNNKNNLKKEIFIESPVIKEVAHQNITNIIPDIPKPKIEENIFKFEYANRLNEIYNDGNYYFNKNTYGFYGPKFFFLYKDKIIKKYNKDLIYIETYIYDNNTKIVISNNIDQPNKFLSVLSELNNNDKFSKYNDINDNFNIIKFNTTKYELVTNIIIYDINTNIINTYEQKGYLILQ